VSTRSRRIVALALPATVTLLADPIMGLVDTAVVGRLGAAELGALGLAVSVLAAGSWVFNFLVFGTTSAVARAVGGRDLHTAGRRVSHAVQVALLLGTVVGSVLLVLAPMILRGLGAVRSLLEPATTYLRIRAVGIPFLLLGFVGHGAFRGVSDTRTPLGVAIGANVVNAALTFWLVLGLDMGIAGAAWATVVAEVLTVLAFALLLRRTGCPSQGTGSRPRRARRAVRRQPGPGAADRRAGARAAGGRGRGRPGRRRDRRRLPGALPDDAAALVPHGRHRDRRAGHGRDRARQRVTRRRRGRPAGPCCGGAPAAGSCSPSCSGSARGPATPPDRRSRVLATVATAWWLLALGQVVNGPVYALDGVLMGAEDFAYLRTWTLLAGVVGGVAGQVVASLGGGLLGLWAAVQLLMLVRLCHAAVARAWERLAARRRHTSASIAVTSAPPRPGCGTGSQQDRDRQPDRVSSPTYPGGGQSRSSSGIASTRRRSWSATSCTKRCTVASASPPSARRSAPAPIAPSGGS
jgi:Na+-driven multidrug efflux pump